MLASVAAFLTLSQGMTHSGFQDDGGGRIDPFVSHRPTVLVFVLADCPIARKYSPEIKRLIADYPKVAFFAVHADPAATVTVARSHRREFGLPCPELLDPRHRLVELAHAKAVPTAALFSPDGRLVYSGRIDDRFPALGIQRETPRRRDLRIALDELLAGKAVSVPRTPVVGCTVPRL